MLQPRRASEFGPLRGAGRAGNRRGQPGAGDLPGQRYLGRRGMVGLGDGIERSQHAVATRGQVSLAARAARTLGQVRLTAVLARQKAAGQAAEVDHAQPFPAAKQLQVGFERGAVHQVVQRLQAFIARQAQARAGGQRFLQARRRVVTRADGAHLPLGDQLGKGGQGFFQRRARVVVMRLVQVNAVGLQAAQRFLDRLADPAP